MKQVHHINIDRITFEKMQRFNRETLVIKNDRNFSTGHIIKMFEITDIGNYTGNQINAEITDIITDFIAGIEHGYCVLCFKRKTCMI